MITLQFLVTSLVVVLIPGPGVVFTVSTGILHGRRASVFGALGCTAGILPHLVATVLGLAALLHASAVAFQVLKLAGVAYLFYLAWTAWRDKAAFVICPQRTVSRAPSLVLKAFLLNILNPKLTIFFLAFLPQFVAPGSAHSTLAMVELSAVFMAVTFAIFALYGVCAAALRARVLSRPRVMTWLQRSFGGAFLLLAGRLAITER